MEYIESVIVGGGQAGLATSYFLNQEGHEHVIFEKSPRAANVWSSERWDSFKLATPNWTVRMPGVEVEDGKRDKFMSRNEIVSFFDDYSTRYKLPVMYKTGVKSVEKNNHEYLVKTDAHTFKAKNVIIATGFFQTPTIPEWASVIPADIMQLHSTKYRNPSSLPPGAVLVVGTGQSGCQIAEELYLVGRKVFLSTGGAGRILRRYRGKDVVEWLDKLHFFDLTPDKLPPGRGRFDPVPHVSGTRGGHNLNLHQFARDGVRLLGKLTKAEGQKVFIAPNLYDNLRRADEFDFNTRNMIDSFITKNMMNVPLEDISVLSDGYDQPIIKELDLKEENINTIIWAGGYSYDYKLVKLPVYDSDGYPMQQSGVTRFPGLYFVGIPWAPSYRSGFLLGVGENAKHIAMNILEGKTDSKHETVS